MAPSRARWARRTLSDSAPSTAKEAKSPTTMSRLYRSEASEPRSPSWSSRTPWPPRGSAIPSWIAAWCQEPLATPRTSPALLPATLCVAGSLYAPLLICGPYPPADNDRDGTNDEQQNGGQDPIGDRQEERHGTRHESDDDADRPNDPPKASPSELAIVHPGPVALGRSLEPGRTARPTPNPNATGIRTTSPMNAA